MPFFFNGRSYITPAVVSKVDDSAMFNPNLSVGNVLAVVGSSIGGAPNTPLVFGSPSDAKAALIGGDLVDAITRAFTPSAQTGGPSKVIAIRVNPAVQAALSILDGSAATVIDLASADYGLWTNQIKVKIAAATGGIGFQVTVQFTPAGGVPQVYTADNILLQPFSVQYTGGGGSAQMTITQSTLSLAEPTGTPVASIDLNVYSTVQQLVDKINTVAGFSATVLNGAGNVATLNGLDNISAQDVKTALYTVNAHLQAVVNWLNTAASNLVVATRHAGAGTLPAVLGFTYLSGGTDGSTTNTQWSNAFTTLQTVDCQWVVPCSNSSAIAAMADAHVQFMSNVGQLERRAICGTALSTANSAAIIAAAAINSNRTSLCFQGMYDYNAAGALTLYQPYITAAMLGGMFAGVDPGVALTNKSIAIRGIERKLVIPTETDTLIPAGLICISAGTDGFRVVQSVSTWLTDTKFDKVEQSCGAALDFTARNVRDALKDIKGAPGSPVTMSEALSRAETALLALSKPAPIGPGVLVGDAANPAFKNLAVSLAGDVLSVQFQCSPVIPINYVGVTIFAVPFSGTLSA